MVYEVKETIVQLLDSIVKVAHTEVDTEAAQKLQTFFANLVGTDEKPTTTPHARGGLTRAPQEL